MNQTAPSKHSMTPGVALIITGPQGCGKNTHARKLAAEIGTYVEGEISALYRKDGLHSLLKDEPDVVIIDELPFHHRGDEHLASLVKAPHIEIRPTYSAQADRVRTPYFIFTSNDAGAVKRFSNSRRFAIVELQGKVAA